jgi:antirestriction protein ArdC
VVDNPRREYPVQCREQPALLGLEELIAELGAAFLCAEFGFDGDVRSAGYIASWIELLKADKRAFLTACSHASKAADYLRGLALAELAERAA